MMTPVDIIVFVGIGVLLAVVVTLSLATRWLTKREKLEPDYLDDESVSALLKNWSADVKQAAKARTKKRLFSINYLLKEGFIIVRLDREKKAQGRQVYQILASKDSPNEIVVSPCFWGDDKIELYNVDSTESLVLDKGFLEQSAESD